MRQLEGHRLDQLQAALWDAALRGDIGSTKVVLQVDDRWMWISASPRRPGSPSARSCPTWRSRSKPPS
jgi:hypothetical protein